MWWVLGSAVTVAGAPLIDVKAKGKAARKLCSSKRVAENFHASNTKSAAACSNSSRARSTINSHALMRCARVGGVVVVVDTAVSLSSPSYPTA